VAAPLCLPSATSNANWHYNFPTRKGNMAELATRKFGITCPICKRFCFLGYVEIEETASVGDLRSKLLHQGWKGEIARCDYLKCDGEIFCSWNVAVFPR
jgi:hypothetical protein